MIKYNTKPFGFTFLPLISPVVSVNVFWVVSVSVKYISARL